jgi:hypothetical protein
MRNWASASLKGAHAVGSGRPLPSPSAYFKKKTGRASFV